MSKLIDPIALAWLAHCEREGAPANTLARRRSVLTSVGHAGTATREEVELWWASRSHLSESTRSNDLANLRTFYKWCRIWERRDDDPSLRLTAPKVPNGLPRPISRADLQTALRTFPPDLRRATCLGAYAGLRVSEAAALQWPDIDAEARRARINKSKGGKSRLVAIGTVLLDELLPDTGGNVVTGKDAQYSAAQLQRRINRALRGAGIDATFHQLRHRYGTMAYQATGDLLAVGRQMGHSSPVTTAIYAAASDEVADKIAEAVAR